MTSGALIVITHFLHPLFLLRKPHRFHPAVLRSNLHLDLLHPRLSANQVLVRKRTPVRHAMLTHGDQLRLMMEVLEMSAMGSRHSSSLNRLLLLQTLMISENSRFFFSSSHFHFLFVNSCIFEIVFCTNTGVRVR